MALQRASTLYFETAVTVDTGGTVDVRALDSSVAEVTDSSASILNSTQNSNAERRWDPATGSSTTTQNAATTQDGKGWAIPTADMDPGDARCTTRIAAQQIDVFLRGTASGTGTGNVGANDVFTPRASLWKWNTSTNTGTLIVGGSGTAVTISAVLAYTNTEWQTTVSLTVPATTFAANEVLLVVAGGNVACGAGLLSAARTTTWTLITDHSSYSKITFATIGLTQRCDVSPTGTLALGGRQLLSDNERGFETSAPAGWTSANTTLSQETTLARSGTKSLKATATGTSAQGVYTPAKAAVAGDTFQFEVWVRSGTAGYPAQLFVQFLASDGTTVLLNVAGAGNGIEVISDVATGSWQYMSLTARAPASTAFVVGAIAYYTNVAGRVLYVDDASVATPTLIRTPIKRPTGSITPTSVVARRAARRLDGSLTPTAVVLRQPTKYMASTLPSSGLLVRRPTILLDGHSITPGPSSLTRRPAKLLTSTITPTSTVAFFLRKYFTGTMTPTGNVTKRPTKYATGSITPGPSTLVRRPTKLLAANITPTAIVRSLLTKNFRSDLGVSGALVRRISKYMSGTVSPSGSLRKTPNKSFTGYIGPEGGGVTVTNIFRKIFIDD